MSQINPNRNPITAPIQPNNPPAPAPVQAAPTPTNKTTSEAPPELRPKDSFTQKATHETDAPNDSSNAESYQAEDVLLEAREKIAQGSNKGLESSMLGAIRGDKGAVTAFREKKNQMAEGFTQLADRYAKKGGDPRIASHLKKMGKNLKNMNFTSNGVRYLQKTTQKMKGEMAQLAGEIRGEAASNPNSFTGWELGQLNVAESLFKHVEGKINVDTDQLQQAQKTKILSNIAALPPFSDTGTLQDNLANLESHVQDYLEVKGVRNSDSAPAMQTLKLLQQVPKVKEAGDREGLTKLQGQIQQSLNGIQDTDLKTAVWQVVGNSNLINTVDDALQMHRRELLIDAAKVRYNDLHSMAGEDMKKVVAMTSYGLLPSEQDYEKSISDEPTRLKAFQHVKAIEGKIQRSVKGAIGKRFDAGINGLNALRDSDNLYEKLSAEAQKQGSSLERYMEVAFQADEDQIKSIKTLHGALNANPSVRNELNKQLQSYMDYGIKEMQYQKNKLKDTNPYALLKKFPAIRQEVYQELGFKSEVVKSSLLKKGEDAFPPVVDQSDLLDLTRGGSVTNDTELVFLIQAEDQDDDQALAEGVLDALDFAVSVGLTITTGGAGAALYTVSKSVAGGFIADDEHEESLANLHANLNEFSETAYYDDSADVGMLVAEAAVSVALDKVDVLGEGLTIVKNNTKIAQEVLGIGMKETWKGTRKEVVTKAFGELAEESAGNLVNQELQKPAIRRPQLGNTP